MKGGDSVVVHPSAVHLVKAGKHRFLTQVVTINCGGVDDKFVVDNDEGTERNPKKSKSGGQVILMFGMYCAKFFRKRRISTVLSLEWLLLTLQARRTIKLSKVRAILGLSP